MLGNTFIAGFVTAVGLGINYMRKENQRFQDQYNNYSDELEVWVNQAKNQEQKTARRNAKIITLKAYGCMRPFSFQNGYYLGLQELGLDEIPPGLSKMSSITDADLFGNNLTNADQILDLPNLKELNLNNNPRLTQIPKTTSDHNSLQSLSCNQCCIHNIGGHIKHLKELSILSLASNKINKIPSEVSACTNLEMLEIHNNKIDHPLPKSLENLKKLRDLHTDRAVKENHENKRIFAVVKTNAANYREKNHIKSENLTSSEINELIANGDVTISDLLIKHPALSSFFQALQTTPAWSNQKETTIQNIREIINHMLTDPDYSDRCIGMANEGTTSCTDRATYYYLLMMIELKAGTITKESPIKNILNFAKTRAMINATYQAAQKNILQEDSKNSTNKQQQENQNEETEFCLAYLENVKDILNIELPSMEFDSFIELDQKLLTENKKYLQNDHAMHEAASTIILNDDYLSQCNTISSLLSPIDEHFGQLLEESLNNSNTADQDIKVKAETLQAEKRNYQNKILLKLYEGSPITSIEKEIKKDFGEREKPKKTRKRISINWLTTKGAKRKRQSNNEEYVKQIIESFARQRKARTSNKKQP